MRPAPPKGEPPPVSGRYAKPPRGNPPSNGRKRTPQNMRDGNESEDPRVKDSASGSGGIHCYESRWPMETDRGLTSSPLLERNKRHQGVGANENSCSRYLFIICFRKHIRIPEVPSRVRDMTQKHQHSQEPKPNTTIVQEYSKKMGGRPHPAPELKEG